MVHSRLAGRGRKQLLILLVLSLAQVSFSQSADSTKIPNQFGGAVSVTNNGISLLPTFSLGKPAAIVDAVMGRRLTFEPQLRFALEGQPWSFIFWWRYKLVNSGKFRLTVGAHPSLVFRATTVEVNGVSRDVMVSQRFAAAELAPNYFVAKNISVGVYYLTGFGFEQDAVRRTHFLTINSNFSNIPLAKGVFMKFAPQIYYLRMDDKGGYYVTSTVTLAKKNFPLSILSIMNKVIDSEIATKDFVWNLTLVYSFGQQYVRYDGRL